MNTTITITIRTLSAIIPTWYVTQHTVDIMFYINLCLLFCAFVAATSLIVLCKKTSCAIVCGLASVLVFGFGFVLFVVQLVLYTMSHDGTPYAVYFCMALLYCGFIVGGVYCGMLSRNSHKALCISAAICSIVPPVGAVLMVILSYKINRDSRGQELVFNGYAYTYAALGEFCDGHKAKFLDSAGDASFEKLNKKQTKRKLKDLKRESKTPDGKCAYAAAILTYTPYKYKKALRLFNKAAEAHCVQAMFNLGCYYETGSYVKKDIKKAKSFYTKAADAGDTDAVMRLALINIEYGSAQDGLHILQDRMEENGDIYAKYNIGVCHEKGLGVTRDVIKAVEIYTECANAGMLAAQRRIFAIASHNINSAQNGQFFRTVTDREFVGTFKTMIDGLIEIKKRHAADAADKFLEAVKKHDSWEGVARCLVGTLYIDCGKLPEDRNNGAEYIKSAIPLYPAAKHIYTVVSRGDINKNKKENKENYGT
ncbi:MAG: sel1 repeat family protein [Clostridiales bacterium]|nr:sel1 repeat family protein [Clostridiales bacterium]